MMLCFLVQINEKDYMFMLLMLLQLNLHSGIYSKYKKKKKTTHLYRNELHYFCWVLCKANMYEFING